MCFLVLPSERNLTFAKTPPRHLYTGGSDSLVRIWRTDKGTDQEPDIALDACEAVTSVDVGVRAHDTHDATNCS